MPLAERCIAVIYYLPGRVGLVQRVVLDVAVGVDGLGGAGVGDERINAEEPSKLRIVEARVVVVEADGIEALLTGVAAVAEAGVDAQRLRGGEGARPARAVALTEVGIGQALDEVPGAVGDGDGAAQVIGDGVEPPGLGPAGVDDRDTGQAQGPSDAHAPVHIEPLGAVILVRILLA